MRTKSEHEAYTAGGAALEITKREPEIRLLWYLRCRGLGVAFLNNGIVIVTVIVLLLLAIVLHTVLLTNVMF